MGKPQVLRMRLKAINHKYQLQVLWFLAAIIYTLLSYVANAQTQTRIKDLTETRGVRSNTLIGYGLVVGLNGTGDSKASLATTRASSNLLNQLGMKVNSAEVPTRNLAAVIVTGELVAFARNGEKFDLKVSAVGDAKSLAGGTLLLTPLKAANNEIYANGQGSLAFGGNTAHPTSVLTTATIPAGGTVEREFLPDFTKNNQITLSLKNPDFTTASRVVEKINASLHGFFASADDPSAIKVDVPPTYRERVVDFISEIESLKVEPDSKAVIVFNERTGTLVMGAGVTISPVTISHKDIAIQVVKSPGGSSGKQTTVGELVNSLNKLGMKPADMVSIFQSLQASGALAAQLKFL